MGSSGENAPSRIGVSGNEISRPCCIRPSAALAPKFLHRKGVRTRGTFFISAIDGLIFDEMAIRGKLEFLTCNFTCNDSVLAVFART
jgi:hypothetical protein